MTSAVAGVLTSSTGTPAAGATTITIHESIGVAQRIVHGMGYFGPADDLSLSGADRTPVAGWLSRAYFWCRTCAAFDNLREVDVYRTRAQAIYEAETYIGMEEGTSNRAPAFVAGDAVFTLTGSSAHIDSASKRAVAKPVVTVKASVCWPLSRSSRWTCYECVPGRAWR